MASKHQAIQTQVGIDWSVEKRGRLYNCSQGMATPIGADHPIWFGPLNRKFHGFSDKFGFEYIEAIIGVRRHNVPVFCVVEIKTIAYPTLSNDQKNYLSYVISIGGRAYVAMEDDSGKGYKLIQWEGKL